MRLVGAAEMRAIDEAAIKGLGVPGIDLMERAGAAVAEAAAEMTRGRTVIVCGGGNNGGDGYVAGRLLRQLGHDAQIWALVPGDRLAGDARAARAAAERAGVPIGTLREVGQIEARSGDVVIDALFGTGLTRPPEGLFAAAIERMAALRREGALLLAVDVPSGLSADTGRALGVCASVDRTVTFAFPKRGLVLHPGAALAGEVRVADIGIPAAAAAQVPVRCELLEEAEARALVPPRPPAAHKGDAGRLLVIAGSPGKTGAAHLALCGALRGGAGLVTLAAREAVLPQALAGRPEAMSRALPGEGPLGRADLAALLEAAQESDALVVGPGIARGPETAEVLRDLLEQAGRPAVVDADGLNALSGTGPGLVGLPSPVVATPHPGEMARLCGCSIAEVQADRIELAARKAREWGCVVVLKGAGTVVAGPHDPPSVIPTGNAGMATGGTGDVLAGLTGALLAARLPSFDAARIAAYVHGAAGDLAAERWGQRGLLASDLADALGPVWARWNR